ncbi:MAG: hypothetical protein QW478_00745 [Candidatus Micrarchaeaceae archaeon]
MKNIFLLALFLSIIPLLCIIIALYISYSYNGDLIEEKCKIVNYTIVNKYVYLDLCIENDCQLVYALKSRGNYYEYLKEHYPLGSIIKCYKLSKSNKITLNNYYDSFLTALVVFQHGPIFVMFVYLLYNLCKNSENYT